MKKPAATRRGAPKRAAKARPKRRPKRRPKQPSLAERLREAEATLEAIRTGQVDALVVQGPAGQQVFTLRGADHRYRQLIERMNEGALMVGPDGTIAYGNARFASLVGVPLEEMIGSSFHRYVPEPSRPLVEAMLRTRDGDAPLKSEAELLVTGGGRTPVYLSATPGGDEDQALTCIIVTDLRDQKRNREMLAAEELTARIVDQAAEGIVVCDLEGLIVRASQAAHRAAGDNPLLRSFEAVFPLRAPGEPAAAATILARALRGETVTGYEVALPREPGPAAELLLSAGPIASPGGDVLGCVISFVDITERKRAAEERIRLLDAANTSRIEAEAANRAKDEFLAMLGHELRNPLAPILTALDLMKLRGDDATDRERGVIERQMKHLVTLVGDLLDVSRISQGKVELDVRPVELARVVEKALEAVQPLVEERAHRLIVQVPPGLWVHGDETRLCQIISNLLTNAAKYTPAAGRIEIRAERRGAELVVAVRDNGTGIPPDLMPHLFDLFVQGKRTIERASGGLGLGLSIVKNLVMLHGGRVDVRSDGVGRGSEFLVHLPALGGAPPAERPEPEPPPPLPARARTRRRILVVDDNVDAAELLAEILDALGHELRIAYDGQTALDVAAQFAPEIAILDIGLPLMDGYEVARRLHARADGGRRIHLIALSGYGRGTDQARSAEAGFDAHLVKPVDVELLEATIEELP